MCIRDSDRIDADIAKAMMSINAVKAVEIGAGFLSVTQKGTEHRDEIDSKKGFLSNVKKNGRYFQQELQKIKYKYIPVLPRTNKKNAGICFAEAQQFWYRRFPVQFCTLGPMPASCAVISQDAKAHACFNSGKDSDEDCKRQSF